MMPASGKGRGSKASVIQSRSRTSWPTSSECDREPDAPLFYRTVAAGGRTATSATIAIYSSE